MLVLIAASILASAPQSTPEASAHRPPEVRATGTATVRLISSATIRWDSPEDQDLPAPRHTTLTLENRLVEAKLIEFQ